MVSYRKKEKQEGLGQLNKEINGTINCVAVCLLWLWNDDCCLGGIFVCFVILQNT